MVEVLGNREGDIVGHLARLRFLTASQLAEFVLGGSPAPSRSRLVMTRRLLAALKGRGLVATTARSTGGPAAGSACLIYYLTPAGVRIARSLWADASTKRLKSSGTFLARHALATADVVLAFRRAALAEPDHELVAWECDWQAALPLGSSFVVPDAYVLYRVGERRLHAFVEIDMGTEHTRFVAGKFRRYLELHDNGGWRARFPVWPLVLVAAESDARAAQLRRVCEALLSLPGGGLGAATSLHFASLAEVTGAGGPLREIWQVVGRSDRVGLAPSSSRHSTPCE